MDSYRRRQAILAMLESAGEVKITDLADQFAVSPNSIRNDLDFLEEEGLLQRVRGGAVPPKASAPLVSKTVTRASVNRREKQIIGQWAAGMVRHGDAIILDASSSALQLAACLRDLRNLIVLTNGLDAALLLAQNPTNRVLLAANVVSTNGSSLVGALPPELAQGFSATFAFVSCAGLTVEQGLTDGEGDIAQIKTQMLRLARRIVALVDHSKIGVISTFRFADLGQIDHLVTDEGTRSGVLDNLRRTCRGPVTVVSDQGAETFASLQTGGRRYRIGFGNLTERMVFARQVRASLEEAALSYPNIELLVRDNDLDRAKAIDNAAWFVEQKVDLVIEYQIDAAAGNVLMDRLNRHNIPVIAVDIPLPGATYFGADNYRAGYMAGAALGQSLKTERSGRLDVLLKLQASRVGAAVHARLQGLQEGVESVLGSLDNTAIVEIDGPVLIEETQIAVLERISSLPRTAVVGVIGINDEAVVGALHAFEQMGRLDQVVGVGQNADQVAHAALRRPDFPFIGSTRFAPEAYGPDLLALAMRILRGEPAPPAVYLQHIFVTPDNLDRYYPQSAQEMSENGRSDLRGMMRNAVSV